MFLCALQAQPAPRRFPPNPEVSRRTSGGNPRLVAPTLPPRLFYRRAASASTLPTTGDNSPGTPIGRRLVGLGRVANRARRALAGGARRFLRGARPLGFWEVRVAVFAGMVGAVAAGAGCRFWVFGGRVDGCRGPSRMRLGSSGAGARPRGGNGGWAGRTAGAQRFRLRPSRRAGGRQGESPAHDTLVAAFTLRTIRRPFDETDPVLPFGQLKSVLRLGGPAAGAADHRTAGTATALGATVEGRKKRRGTPPTCK